MCARYTLSRAEKEILAAYAAELERPFTPNYNVAITNEMPVITADEPNKIKFMHFQLVPYTAKSPKDTKFTFNTRDDKIMGSNLWRPLFVKHKRCLVLADGFYEWDRLVHPEDKQPYRFTLKDRDIFAYAGLWSKWSAEGQDPYYSFSIITTEANELVGEYHDKHRMPVILDKKDEALWLSKDVAPEQLLPLLHPYPDELMNRYRASKRVNYVNTEKKPNNDPGLLIEENSL
jgi:putative SOS response-associated peptidase YedK